MAFLGTPIEYEAVICESLTGTTVKHLDWSSISWGRARNEITQADVTIPYEDGGKLACGILSTTRGWNFMLRIERDGYTVWDGPITGMHRDEQGNVTVRAHDRFAIAYKRLIRVHRSYPLADNKSPWNIIQELVSDALIGNITYDPYPISVVAGTGVLEAVGREYFPDRLERIYDVIQELIDSTHSAFFTQITTDCRLSEYDIRHDIPFPRLILNEKTTIGVPAVDIDWLDQATNIYAGGSAEGIAGFPQIATATPYVGVYVNGLLEKSAGSTQSGDNTDLGYLATRLAVEAASGSLTVERLRLSPSFGCPEMMPDLSNLLPGVFCVVDFDETCAFDQPFTQYTETDITGYGLTATSVQAVRLDTLEVKVTSSREGVDEQVLGSFRPVIPEGYA